MPKKPRNFHYWQPAPSWRPLPWLVNHGNQAMSPHTEWETGTCHTEFTVRRGREDRGNARRHAPKQNNAHCKRYSCEGCQHVSVQAYMESWCMHISKTPLTTTGAQAHFVVNSVKLHSTAFRVQLVVYTFLECIILILIYYTNYVNNSMLQCIPHIKLQKDVKVSLWMKRMDCILISFSTVLSTVYDKSFHFK